MSKTYLQLSQQMMDLTNSHGRAKIAALLQKHGAYLGGSLQNVPVANLLALSQELDTMRDAFDLWWEERGRHLDPSLNRSVVRDIFLRGMHAERSQVPPPPAAPEAPAELALIETPTQPDRAATAECKECQGTGVISYDD